MSFPRYPEYKGSGVEWLGNVPDHWEVVRVRWLCEIKKRIVGELGFDVLSITQRGIRIKDTESNDGQLSMDYSKYQLVEVGDFAMNHMDLLTGYVDISPVQGVTSPDYRVFSLRNPVRCHAKFFLYLFQNGYLNKVFYPFGQGSSQLGRWRLPTEQFNDFWFPVPSFEEQSAIATFLDRETAKIDALVAEQEKLIALLQEKRQAVISHAVTKGLNPNVPMKDSGVEWLGEVPGHWEAITLRRCAVAVQTGGTPSADALSESLDEGFFWYTPGDFGSSLKLSTSTRRIANEAVASGEAKVFPPQSVLIVSIGATLGKVGFAQNTSSANQQINAVIPGSRVDGYFLAWSLSVKAEMMRFLSNASTIGIMNQEKTKEIWIALPPREEQTAIAAFLDRETAKLDTLMAEARTAIILLQERRTALISAAVTGQIDVRGLVGSANAPDSIAASAYPASA